MASPLYNTNPFLKVQNVAHVAAGLGALITMTHGYGIIRPDVALSLRSFPRATTPKDQKLMEGLARSFSTTRVVVGLSSLTAWWFGAYRVLGFQTAFGVLMGVVDGLVSKQLLGEGEWMHWSFVPVGLGVGSLLIAST